MLRGSREIATSIRQVFATPTYIALFLVNWLLILTLFLLISRSSVLAYVFFSGQFDSAGKLAFLADVYVKFLSLLANPLVLSAFFFTVLAALNITLLVYMARVMQRRASSKSSLGAASAVVTSHILSCGSSLLAPFFSALAGSSAYNSPARLQVALLFGLGLNLIGLVLVLRSTASVARCINDMAIEPYNPQIAV